METTFPPEQKTKSKFLRILLIGLLSFCLILVVFFLLILHDIPGEDEIKNFLIHSTVDSFQDIDWHKNNQPIRRWVPLTAISENLQKAVIISEDDTFYEHEGINFKMMREAFRVNWQRGRYARGASTITMQVARNAFLSKEKSLIRKLKEIILTRRIEKTLSKQRILELYLNLIEWGKNIYGAEAAAQFHFGKSAANLNLAEASILAAILPNPVRFSPFTRMKTVKKFQQRILDLMVLSRLIDEKTAAETYKMPIHLRGMEPPHMVLPDSLSDHFSEEFTQNLHKDTSILDPLDDFIVSDSSHRKPHVQADSTITESNVLQPDSPVSESLE